MGKTQQLGIAMYLKCKGNFSFFLEGGGGRMVTRDKQNLTIETLSLSNLYIYTMYISLN